MANSAHESRTISFGEFVVDCRAGELYRHGHRVKVQQQPMQVLLALFESPG